MPPGGRVASGLGLGLASLAVACAVLLPLRDELSPGTVALIMLLPILPAALGGAAAAVVVALASALAFNLLFTEPYYSPTIESAESVAALVAYLVVAVAVGVLLGRARSARAAAAERERELDLLRSVASDLLRRPDPAPAIAEALRRLREGLALRGVAARLGWPEPGLTVSDGDAARALAAVTPGEGLRPVRAHGLLVTPVAAAGGLHGLLAVDAGERAVTTAEARLIADVADVLGLASARLGLDRERIARESLEEAERLRTALTRAVSHDLRTPLAGIQAAAGALRHGAPEDERDALAADIEREAVRLGRMVSDLLDMSRIEAGGLEPRRDAVPVAELVGEAVDAAAGALDGRQVRVRAAPGLAVLSDEAMMRQVLVNLIENAVRHAPGAGAIEVHAEPVGDRVVLRVADHGPGIAPGDRERVLDPFVRVGAAAPGRGAGLGLAIGRGLVEAQDGRLRVEGTPGGGTTVVVELPRAAAP